PTHGSKSSPKTRRNSPRAKYKVYKPTPPLPLFPLPPPPAPRDSLLSSRCSPSPTRNPSDCHCPRAARPMNGGGSGLAPNAAHTADEVFRDYKGRRAGMIKALTTDVERFFKLCDPEKENLCLYGYPDETWEVTLPAEEVPPEIPEPALGINFARDGMNEKDWLALVAVHSDSWLLSVAFYFGARFGFDRETRRRLFSLINNMPTIFEVVTGAAKKQAKEKTPNSSSKSNRPSSKV
ncbi:hypothetical protein ACJX0J_035746, partial [Zea mays]